MYTHLYDVKQIKFNTKKILSKNNKILYKNRTKP